MARGIWWTTAAPGRMTPVTSTRHIALLGGFRDAPTAAPDTYNIAAEIGGANLDLSNATIPPQGITINKWSLVGGVAVKLPADCRVEISGFNLVGRRRLGGARSTAEGPLVRIRAYGAFGGVRVD